MINERLEQTAGLTAGDVIDTLLAGIGQGDFYIKAATESQGGADAINAAVQQRMQAQISGKAPPTMTLSVGERREADEVTVNRARL